MGLITPYPSLVTTALIIPETVAPIRWLKKYGGITLIDDDVLRAQIEMRRELLLVVGAIIAQGIVGSVLILLK